MRCRSRELYFERARAHKEAGNDAAAYDCYQKAVDISPALAKQFIEACSPFFLCRPWSGFSSSCSYNEGHVMCCAL